MNDPITWLLDKFWPETEEERADRERRMAEARDRECACGRCSVQSETGMTGT